MLCIILLLGRQFRMQPFMMKRSLLTVLISYLLASVANATPNFVIIFCDDLGYGDLSCFGHPTIHTPHLDRMAQEGQKWTNFYAAAPVCTPSRAGLLTGRLPIRTGMCSDKRAVLFPDSSGGLPQSEITIAEALKKVGYATAAVGKWHLGHLPEFLPTNHGFDSYFGVPYSNDMDRIRDLGPKGREGLMKPESHYWNIPLIRGSKEIERSPQQAFLTKRYVEESVNFIKAQAKTNKPFFLYLAHSMPHVPIFASGAFSGISAAGRYGDVIEEIDWSVGQVLDTLREQGLAEETIVVFTSDNGPWLPFKTHGGSAGHLRDGKGSTWEGGMREPTVFWGPGKVKPGRVVQDMGSTLDLFATFLDLANQPLPNDVVYDGQTLAPALTGRGTSGRDTMFYYRGEQLRAVRHGDYKAHFVTKTEYMGQKAVKHDPPLLYHLGHDPGEKFDVAAEQPEMVAKLTDLAAQHKASFTPPASHLEGRISEP